MTLPLYAVTNTGPRQAQPVGAQEAADIIGVSTARLRQLRHTRGFPKPHELACGPVWTDVEIKAWDARRQEARRQRALANSRYTA